MRPERHARSGLKRRPQGRHNHRRRSTVEKAKPGPVDWVHLRGSKPLHGAESEDTISRLGASGRNIAVFAPVQGVVAIAREHPVAPKWSSGPPRESCAAVICDTSCSNTGAVFGGWAMPTPSARPMKRCWDADRDAERRRSPSGPHPCTSH